MRRLTSKVGILGALVALLMALSGCGGGADDAASPLDNALGYLPKDAPLVASIDTDIDGEQYEAIGKLIDKFPFGDALKGSIRRLVEDEGGELKDIEPLLGNEFVVGSADVGSLTGESEDGDFVGAVQAKSGEKLEQAVKRERSKKTGEKDGATLYEDDDGDPFALKDDVLIVADSKKLLEAALAQRGDDGRLTEETFDKATDTLPKDALFRVAGDLQKLLANDPDTKEALKVKWVKALRTFGATASFQGDEANIDFRLNTDPGDLTDRDLPVAAGSQSPSVIDRAGEIAASLRDPTQIIDFAEDVAQAIDPSGFGDYATAKRTIEKQLDVSIENDLLDQLEGDLSISFTVNGRFGARAQVKDPGRFDKTLASLGKVLPDVAESAVDGSVGYSEPKKGGDFYALATQDGGGVVYGVKDGAFVIANDARLASELSKESTKKVPGAGGSVVVNADAGELVKQALGQLSGLGLAGALATGPLKDLTGSLSAETSAISGNFKLSFD